MIPITSHRMQKFPRPLRHRSNSLVGRAALLERGSTATLPWARERTIMCDNVLLRTLAVRDQQVLEASRYLLPGT
jgi:hypothetical protein